MSDIDELKSRLPIGHVARETIALARSGHA
jgi:hypothetical protein